MPKNKERKTAGVPKVITGSYNGSQPCCLSTSCTSEVFISCRPYLYLVEGCQEVIFKGFLPGELSSAWRRVPLIDVKWWKWDMGLGQISLTATSWKIIISFLKQKRKAVIPESETAIKECWVSRVKIIEWAWSQGSIITHFILLRYWFLNVWKAE